MVKCLTLLAGRLVAGQRTLTPSAVVRIHPRHLINGRLFFMRTLNPSAGF